MTNSLICHLHRVAHAEAGGDVERGEGRGRESGGGVTLLQEEGGQTWRRESCETFQSNREDAPVLCTRRRVKPSSDQLQRKREMDSQTAVNEAVVYPPPSTSRDKAQM